MMGWVARSPWLVAIAFIGCGFLEDPEPDPSSLPVPVFQEVRSIPALPDAPPSGIVLIVIDTQRADHLGAYGETRGLTPRLDELAQEAHVFTDTTATASWTRPSIATMFTGLYPTSSTVETAEDQIPTLEKTVAEALQEAGYQTMAISGMAHLSPEFGFGQGFEKYHRPTKLNSYGPGGVPRPTAEGITEDALRFLDERDPERPFFLWAHYIDPHAPYFPHPDMMELPEPPGRFNGSMVEIRQLELIYQRMRFSDPDNPVTEPLVDADFERIRYLYASEVKYCDFWLGQLFDGMRERDLWDDTLVIVTADHGEMLWEHEKLGHGFSLYEPVVQVPLLVREPGMKSGDGTRVETPISLIDLAPSILSRSGIEIPARYQGRGWWPLTREGVREDGEAIIYSELSRNHFDEHMLREGDRKLIEQRREKAKSHPESVRVFDLSLDPAEMTNLAGRRGSGDKRLRALVARWFGVMQDQEGIGESQSLDESDPKIVEELRALGYIE